MVAAVVSTAALAEAFTVAVAEASMVAVAEVSMAADLTAAPGLLAEEVITGAAGFAVNPAQVASERAAIRTEVSADRAA